MSPPHVASKEQQQQSQQRGQSNDFSQRVLRAAADLRELPPAVVSCWLMSQCAGQLQDNRFPLDVVHFAINSSGFYQLTSVLLHSHPV